MWLNEITQANLAEATGTSQPIISGIMRVDMSEAQQNELIGKLKENGYGVSEK